MREAHYVDDRGSFADAEMVTIDWPGRVKKPHIGIVRDFDEYPRWTRYCRFFEHNSFHYEIYNLHAHDWLEHAEKYDVIVGIPSCESYHLQEMQRKYYVLEAFLGKTCYPNTGHALLYEDKSLEAYISKAFGLPFVNTYISHDKQDAMRLVETLAYPVVSKIVPASGSLGVELVRSRQDARRIVDQAFSRNGRKTHVLHFRQKNFVYFQDYVPSDGYDIRVMVIGNRAFGFYRKAPQGDFRASGMDLVEKRELPADAIKIAWAVNKAVRSPMLVVDMLHGLDGRYYIIEFSPVSGHVETPEQLHVNGLPGAYVFDDDESFHFEEGKYWVQELAVKEFLLNDYLPKVFAEKV
jgi:glutathione synthase/RimK-type ligase-like ATP-grasp enzyme